MLLNPWPVWTLKHADPGNVGSCGGLTEAFGVGFSRSMIVGSKMSHKRTSLFPRELGDSEGEGKRRWKRKRCLTCIAALNPNKPMAVKHVRHRLFIADNYFDYQMIYGVLRAKFTLVKGLSITPEGYNVNIVAGSISEGTVYILLHPAKYIPPSINFRIPRLYRYSLKV